MRAVQIAAFILCSLPLAAQHGSTTAVNPYTSPDHAQAGGKLFRAQCAGCHGLDGAGTGAGPSLASGTFRHGDSDEAVFRSVSKGVPGTTMPAFAFSGLQIWELVTHVRALAIAHAPAQLKGDAQAGASIFQTNCSGCHAVKGEGGLSGPDLTFAGARRSPAHLRQSVLDPDAEVASDYWSVIATTVSGQTIRGIRLNEDTHSIQIRDERGKLVSLLKPEITKVELVRQSPMPSFKGKLSETQMSDLIVYLTSLRGDQ